MSTELFTNDRVRILATGKETTVYTNNGGSANVILRHHDQEHLLGAYLVSEVEKI